MTRRFTILNAVLYTRASDLVELVNSESRVMLLYCTREEAIHILNNARDLKITGENYVWVAAQSVIATGTPPTQFPVGMLGENNSPLSGLINPRGAATQPNCEHRFHDRAGLHSFYIQIN